MALQVTLHIQPKGSGSPLAEFNYVRIQQDMHTHHTFEVGVPFDYLESRQASFMQQAHQELVGQPITFSLTPDQPGPGQQFAFTGFVTDIVVASDNDYTGSFIIRGYSPTCLLTDGVQRRTFVNQTLEGIVGQVLQPYRSNLLPTAKNLTTKGALPYVVQYNESSFDFLNRLLAECHEWFFYDGTTLQFGMPAKQSTVALEMNRHWSGFQLEAAIRPTQVALHGYDATQHQHWNGSSPSQASGVGGNQFAQFAQQTSGAVFAQPSHGVVGMPATSRTDVQTAATGAGAAVAAGGLTFRGRSENPDLRLGTIIDASAEGLGSDNLSVNSLGKYRIVQLTHEVDYTGGYTNSFVAVLHSLTQPPANPQVRPQPGLPELAEVIDVADPQKIGRVRVRYYWPVEKPLNAESIWLRVLTPYAGDGKGQLFTPEIGSQVLINYEQNRAEQPVVLGNLFHAQNKQNAKYTNPENNLKGLQTAGGNKFVMGDTQGQQHILISNSNNKGTAIQVGFDGAGNVSITTNGPISLTAGGDITLTSKKNITLTADNNVTITAKKSVAVTAQEESASLTGRKKLELTAQSEDLSLTAQAKRVVAKATTNVEITASALTKITGSEVELNKS